MTWEYADRVSNCLPISLLGQIRGERSRRRENFFSVSRQRAYMSRMVARHIDRRSAAKTLLCNNNDFHLQPMCIIFGMIERNVLRVVTLACVPTASGREKLAHLRISTSRGKPRGVQYCRTILHRMTVLGTRLPPSFPIPPLALLYLLPYLS